MKGYVLIIIMVINLLGCSDKDSVLQNPSTLVPHEANLVFKVHAPNEFKNLLKTHPLFLELTKNSTTALLTHLDYLRPKQELLIATFSFKEKTTFAIITKRHQALVALDSSKSVTLTQNEKPLIFKTIYKKDTLYHRTVDSLFFGSNNLELVQSVEKNNPNTEIAALLDKSDTKKAVSVIVKNNNAVSSLLYLNTDNSLKLSEYSVLDFNLQNKSIQYNGIAKGQDSLHAINSFKNTLPQDLNISQIIPETASQFQRIAFDDFTVFSKNNALLKKTVRDSVPSVLNIATEIATFSFETKKALTLYALDTELLTQSLITGASVDVFRDIPIYKFENSDFFSKRLKPFIALDKTNFFFVYENFAVFAEHTETLKSVITQKLNDNTLSNSETFKNLLEDLADDSSYFVYNNNDALSLLLPGTNYNANAVQFIYDRNFAHVNASFKQLNTTSQQQSVTEHFSVSLSSDVLIAPQTVKNHITNTHDIVVQDLNNVLYLISNSGSILWKKQLDGKILGQIEQIDSYKNGRLQLTFVTQNKLHTIDRNGNDVEGFPMSFKDEITQPLSVFDYDNNRNYRLLVTQNNTLLMYDAKGKKVTGFDYNTTKNKIITQPVHFRLANKDYIVFAQGESLQIIDRKGKTRINIKQSIAFSGNPLLVYQNQFTTTTSSGQLIQVNTKGKVTTKALNLSKNHKIESTSKTFVSLSENKLKIGSRAIDLDYGDYTTPRIFYLSDKIYVSTTDKEARKVFVFDSQAKLLPHFPIFGVTGAELQNLDKNSGVELITTTDSKTITVYKLN